MDFTPPPDYVPKLEERVRVLEQQLHQAHDERRQAQRELAELRAHAKRLEQTYAAELDRAAADRTELGVLEATLARLTSAVRAKFRLRHHTYRKF